ncbi:MAG: hypothetical protein SNH63_03600 [Rikenellaceae bacterium]
MKKLLTLSLSLLAFWSCSKDGGESGVVAPLDASLSVTFTSDISTRVYSNGFEIGDTISVAAYSGTKAISTNTLYGFDGYLFDCDTPIEYESAIQDLSFAAVYPSLESSSIMSFELPIRAWAMPTR